MPAYSDIWNGFVLNNTLQNGFNLLELLAAGGQDASVTELSVRAGLPPSHVCRLLKTLLQTGYVEQSEESRRYRVSLKLLHLAHARLVNLDFRRIGRPFVARLAESLQAHAYLSQPLRGLSIVVDVAYPRGAAVDADVVVGQIHSVCHSACGKICAAFATEDERKQLFDDLDRSGTAEPRKARFAEFVRIRKNRFAVRDEAGVLAVAAPLFRAEGRFCGALGAHLPPKSRLNKTIEQEVRRMAEALSFGLGYPFSQ
jgi:DNA-binding IclR family transcriptional regulator